MTFYKFDLLTHAGEDATFLYVAFQSNGKD